MDKISNEGPSAWGQITNSISSPWKIAGRVAVAATGIYAIARYDVHPVLAAVGVSLVSLPSTYLMVATGLAICSDVYIGESAIVGRASTITQVAISAGVGLALIGASAVDEYAVGMLEYVTSKT